jgi:uncharacterized protein YecA (UPF0149 family)
MKESGKPPSSLETLAAKLRELFPEALTGYARMGSAIWKAVCRAGLVNGEPAAAENRIGRNQPCPCGSGKKYKRCCGIRVH